MTAACTAALQTWRANYSAMLFPSGFLATIVSLVVVAAFLAVVVAPIVMRAYGSQVRRLMLLSQAAAPPPAWDERHRRPFRRSIEAPGDPHVDPAFSASELQEASRVRLQRLRKATWVAYAVFIAGSPIVLGLGGNVARGDVIGFALATAALGAVAALVNVHPEGSKKWVLAGMVMLGIVMGALEPADDGVSNAIVVPIALGALYFVMAHRTLRIVVVVMTVWLSAVLVALTAGGWFMAPIVSCMSTDSSVWDVALAGAGGTFALIAFSLFLAAGNRILSVMSQLHDRGFASDISLAVGLGFTLMALLLAFGIAATGRFAYWQVGLVALFWIAATIGAYAWVMGRGARVAARRSLLILRVFSHDRRSERLLDALQTRWRSIGPVYEIAGPDLVRLNVDAWSLARFLTSRLHEAFLFGATGRATLEDRLDSVEDREGRFRVNQVFCLESAWRTTVEQLTRASGAILLDVRGFGRERQGTGFEVELVARTGLLPRTLVLGDGTTDWALFDEHIRLRAACRPRLPGCRSPVARKRMQSCTRSPVRAIPSRTRVAQPRDDR